MQSPHETLPCSISLHRLLDRQRLLRISQRPLRDLHRWDPFWWSYNLSSTWLLDWVIQIVLSALKRHTILGFGCVASVHMVAGAVIGSVVSVLDWNWYCYTVVPDFVSRKHKIEAVRRSHISMILLAGLSGSCNFWLSFILKLCKYIVSWCSIEAFDWWTSRVNLSYFIII